MLLHIKTELHYFLQVVAGLAWSGHGGLQSSKTQLLPRSGVRQKTMVLGGSRLCGRVVSCNVGGLVLLLVISEKGEVVVHVEDPLS